MRKIIIIFISILLFTECKKHVNACKNQTELKDREHLVNLSGINAPELLDTLAKHPELQLYSFNSTSSNWVARCYVFYNDLLIFSDYYLINKTYNSGMIYASDTLLPKNINFSLEPAIPYQDAIKEAKKKLNFDHTCINYRLGLYNINVRNGDNKTKNYKLVWKIQGKEGYPYVIIDANTKEVIFADDGIRYGWVD